MTPVSLRNLPSVDALMNTAPASQMTEGFGRSLTVDAIRIILDETRAQYSVGNETEIPTQDEILARALSRLQAWVQPTLRPVINATGVILHTNLGRAPLSHAAMQAMLEISGGYSNLEFDLDNGKRGSRFAHVEDMLVRLTGAEAAVVVNNNAAAVLLALSALTHGKKVVIPRSQLVEIGGGFRVPDVMKQSGAKLVEIGATNKVNIADFEEAFSSQPALVLRAHRSNFKIIGFTEEPGIPDIARLAHQHGIIFMDDLGSGTLLDTARYGLEHEPTVTESLEAGADLVCFSGDKLLGGPQAGIIAGRADLLTKIKKHPLARAVRVDKTRLAALTATLTHYLTGEAEREIPVWRMISARPEDLNARAEHWKRELGSGSVKPALSTIGGGSMPGETLPTFSLALTPRSPEKFLKKLRAQAVPVIARISDERVLLDPRTTLPEQDELLLKLVKSILE